MCFFLGYFVEGSFFEDIPYIPGFHQREAVPNLKGVPPGLDGLYGLVFIQTKLTNPNEVVKNQPLVVFFDSSVIQSPIFRGSKQCKLV